MRFFTFLTASLVTLHLALATSLISDRNRTSPVRRQLHGNSTEEISTIDISKNESSSLQIGYAEFISSGDSVNFPISPWPWRKGRWGIGKGYFRTIPYCFVDKRSYDRIEGVGCKMRRAITIWADALGGTPNAKSGHALAFTTANGRKDFCCTAYEYGNENQPLADGDLNCLWNTARWPKDTLAIHWLDNTKSAGREGQGTLGYRDSRHDSSIGRHWMGITDHATLADIAHELGHVFGLVHEHQRWDRDDYVEFRCRNLAGMQAAVNHLRDKTKMNDDQAWDKLCNDMDTAHEYKAPSVEYIKGSGLDIQKQPQLDGPEGFDIDSIMMYSSYGGSIAYEHAKLNSAVLVAIKKDAKGKKISGSESMIPDPRKPSPTDAAFVKKFYPWDQSRFDEWKKNHP